MSENTAEQLPEIEKSSPAKIFELLYPGNSYSKLPGFDPRNIGYMFDRYLGIGIIAPGFQELKLIFALEDGGQYAGRLTMGYLDRFSLSRQFQKLVPVLEKTDGGLFRGNSFIDLLREERGEHLGGVASKKISKYASTPAQRITARILGDQFFDDDVYLIGVLDDNNHPSGLIVFYEGKGGIKRRVKESEPKLSLKLKPIAS